MSFPYRPDKVRQLQVVVWISAVIWTGILFGLYLWASSAEKNHLSKLIALRAESVANHTQAVRDWVGGHGGVYVELHAEGDLSYLSGNLPESEVITPSGRKLALLSSSAVLAKISKEFHRTSADHVRLTSNHPMNQYNVPDEWEKKALKSLEGGAKKIEGFVGNGKENVFRLMYPMELQPRCLRCHEYLAGLPIKIVGGLSVTVDKAPYDSQYKKILHQLSLGYFGIWIVGIAGLGIFGVHGSRLLRRIEYASTHDGLTGMKNRREIERRFTVECERADRYHNQLSVMLLDVDHFKQVNDTHGHQIGDEALRVVAEAVRKTIRKTDIAGRYGGEEFLVLVTETSPEGARDLAQRLNAAVKAAQIPLPGDKALSVTVSIGVSSWSPGMSPASLISSADQAMYRAKESGRDRVDVMDSGTA